MKNSCSAMGVHLPLVCVALVLAFLVPADAQEDFSWAHFGRDWKGVCETGASQSPINIVTRRAKHETTNKFHLEYEPSTEVTISNTGHGIVVKASNTSKNYLHTSEGQFRLIQFHFHVVSDHSINGYFAPMEVHFVHVNQDGSHISVLGFFAKFDPDDTPNAFFASFFQDVHNETTTKDTLSLNIGEFIKPMKSSMKALNHYTYPGSLTTPPCSEIVTWYVMKRMIKISIQQMLTISEADAAVSEGNRFNDRAPLPLGDRPLVYREVL